MSTASRTEATRTATFLVSPAAVITFTNCAVFSLAGFVRSVTCDIVGSSSANSSIHLAPNANSKLVKPVALPPGRAKPSINRCPTGSATCVNTTGIVLVDFFAATRPGVPWATITSAAAETRLPASACVQDAQSLNQRRTSVAVPLSPKGQKRARKKPGLSAGLFRCDSLRLHYPRKSALASTLVNTDVTPPLMWRRNA
jgi:hypothetical protein